MGRLIHPEEEYIPTETELSYHEEFVNPQKEFIRSELVYPTRKVIAHRKSLLILEKNSTRLRETLFSRKKDLLVHKKSLFIQARI